MLSFTGSLKVFVALDPIDMRKGFEGLDAAVGEKLKADVRSGALFAFTNKKRTRLSRSLPEQAEKASQRLPEGRACREAAGTATSSTGTPPGCG
jgi:hypothetical protein